MVASGVPLRAGRLFHVSKDSVHESSAIRTVWLLRVPAVDCVVVRTRSTAPVSCLPAGAAGSMKRRYVIPPGLPFDISDVEVPYLVLGAPWLAYVSATGVTVTR